MRSKASISGHPIHPMLVNFPIAFLVGTLVFDLINVFTAQLAFAFTSYFLNVAGIFTGLLAAIPGLVDFVYTVPPKSSGSKRAAKHGILNVTVLILFGIALWYRHVEHPRPLILLSIETIAVVLLGFAGWLGGTLVVRNQIGVDVRYAGAGKWNEAEIAGSEKGSVPVARTSELKTDQMKLVCVDGRRIVVGRTEDGYVAFDDHCSHRGGSLAGGVMICGTVQCPWHGSQFDVRTGAVRCGPAKEPVRTYNVFVEGEEIYLEL